MAMISNIIEDAYIEAVGSSVYDNLGIYLRFGRVSRLFLTHEAEGTADRVNITLRRSRLSGVARATFPDKQSHLVINYCIMF